MLVGRSRCGHTLLRVLFCLACVDEVSAQTSGTRGWVIGLEYGAASVSLAGGPRDGAALVGARIGRALNRFVTPYLGVAYADIESRGLDALDNVTFAHVDFGVRLHLTDDRRRWVPYGDLALTYWPVRDAVRNGKRTGSDFTGGPTLSLGGGLLVYLSEKWSVDVNVKAGRGTFEDAPLGDFAGRGTIGRPGALIDLDASSVRLSAGIAWWP